VLECIFSKTLLVTLLLLGAASFMLYNMDNASTKTYSFEQYKNDFQKEYLKEGEEEYRKAIFLRNLIKIEEHNANPKNTHTLGINQFTDLTDAEFQAIYLTLQVPNRNVEVLDEV
jgi:cathepsin L